MADASYERQHIALHAAGYINGAGTTVLSIGALLTRIGTGHYAMLLDASQGLVDDETFMMVQCKGTTAAAPVVQDLSNTEKRVRTFDTGGAVANTDIEIELYRSVTR